MNLRDPGQQGTKAEVEGGGGGGGRREKGVGRGEERRGEIWRERRGFRKTELWTSWGWVVG